MKNRIFSCIFTDLSHQYADPFEPHIPGTTEIACANPYRFKESELAKPADGESEFRLAARCGALLPVLLHMQMAYRLRHGAFELLHVPHLENGETRKLDEIPAAERLNGGEPVRLFPIPAHIAGYTIRSLRAEDLAAVLADVAGEVREMIAGCE